MTDLGIVFLWLVGIVVVAFVVSFLISWWQDDDPITLADVREVIRELVWRRRHND